MKMDKCYRCLCAFCGNEAGCDNYCEMKEHCSHEPLVHCPDFVADQSEFGIGESRYLACCYS